MGSRPTTDHRIGFTLIEMVITIVLVGIIAGVLYPVLFYGAESYRQQVARREIVSRARMAMERMAREIRQAVPNTIRLRSVIDTEDTIEFGRSVHFSRYTTISGSSPYTLHDNLGLTIPAEPYLIIYNTVPDAFYAYPASSTTFGVTGVGANTVDFAAPMKPDSPTKRYQLSSGPVVFGMTAGGDLIRYSGYAPGQYYLTSAGSADLLIDNVTTVRFRYSPGTLTNTALVTIQLTVASGDQSLEFHQEVHVRNVP